MKKVSIFFLIVLTLVTTGYSQNIDNHDYLGRLNAITTAVPFLLIAPDSRAGAMGDVGAATSADVNSQSYNPAKYVFNKNTFGVSLSYSPWLRKLVDDINLAYLSTYWKITDMDAIAFSLRYFSLGDIQFTDDQGHLMSTQNPNEFSLDFTYSRKLIDELSIAITPRFIYSNLTANQYVGGVDTKPGLAGAADISLFYEQDFKTRNLTGQTLRAGFAITNIGNKMSYSSGTLRRDFLPTNLRLGLGYEMNFDGYNKLAITGEINKFLVPTNPIYATDSNGRIMYDEANNPIIEAGMNPDVSVPVGMIHSFYDAPGGFLEEMTEINFGIGLEYSYRDFFFVRTGYFNENKNKGNRKFLTMGVGFKYNILNIDVSYLFAVQQYHPLANTLRFTLSLDFTSFNRDEIKQQGRLR
ncbi:MAG: type IX secretion system outer membrane channel protein PorV [Bacteroidales bacterium]|nr:type IX secretion system outer membrane channel protein PorV [Bacteroidales bacterium]